MAKCYRCGTKMKRKDGFFCARCKEYLIKHKVYKQALDSILNEIGSNQKGSESKEKGG